MPNFSNLNERDRMVLKSIFDPNATLGDHADEDRFTEECEDVPLTDSDRLASSLEAEGVRLAEEGKHEEALQLLTRAVVEAPGRVAARNNRAQLFRLMGRDDDAMLDLEAALADGIGGAGRARAQALCQRGLLRRKRGEDDAARQDFTEAAKLGSAFAKKQVVELNPYAALCNQMLQKVMSNNE